MMNIFREKCTVLLLEGKDTFDFLSGISASDFRDIKNLKSKRTLFLDSKGRIVDFSVVAFINGAFYVIVSNGNENALFNHFEKYIIMEDIKITRLSLNKFTFFDIAYSPVPGEILINDSYAFNKNILISPNENPFAENKFMTDIDFKLLTFENFYLYNSELLNSNVNPLECGLKEFISFKKGCYIGQEVIARLDAQEKIPKQLVFIESLDNLIPNDNIFVDDSDKKLECGQIYFAVQNDNIFYALAFIRSGFLNKNEFYSKNNILIKIKKYINDHKH